MVRAHWVYIAEDVCFYISFDSAFRSLTMQIPADRGMAVAIPSCRYSNFQSEYHHIEYPASPVKRDPLFHPADPGMILGHRI